MANPFLKILNNPSTGINVELNKQEKATIIKAIEEKANNAITEHTNVRIAHGQRSHDDVYEPLNNWLWWLNNMWDGKLNYTFEQQASSIGLTSYELYKVLIDVMIDVWPLALISEIESDIDNNAYIINDSNSKYDCEGVIDNSH
jgi:hypothetical protein